MSGRRPQIASSMLVASAAVPAILTLTAVTLMHTVPPTHADVPRIAVSDWSTQAALVECGASFLASLIRRAARGFEGPRADIAVVLADAACALWIIRGLFSMFIVAFGLDAVRVHLDLAAVVGLAVFAGSVAIIDIVSLDRGAR